MNYTACCAKQRQAAANMFFYEKEMDMQLYLLGNMTFEFCLTESVESNFYGRKLRNREGYSGRPGHPLHLKVLLPPLGVSLKAWRITQAQGNVGRRFVAQAKIREGPSFRLYRVHLVSCQWAFEDLPLYLPRFCAGGARPVYYVIFLKFIFLHGFMCRFVGVVVYICVFIIYSGS